MISNKIKTECESNKIDSESPGTVVVVGDHRRIFFFFFFFLFFLTIQRQCQTCSSRGAIALDQRNASSNCGHALGISNFKFQNAFDFCNSHVAFQTVVHLAFVQYSACLRVCIRNSEIEFVSFFLCMHVPCGLYWYAPSVVSVEPKAKLPLEAMGETLATQVLGLHAMPFLGPVFVAKHVAEVACQRVIGLRHGCCQRAI